MMILSGPLKNTKGIRQLVDQIVLTEESDGQRTSGCLRKSRLRSSHVSPNAETSILLRLHTNSIARQILKALSNTHKQDIVHTG